MATTKPEAERKDTIGFRVTAPERRVLEAAARLDERPLSHWIRRVLLAAAKAATGGRTR